MNVLSRCLLAMLGTLAVAQARPVFIENVSTLENPDPAVWAFPAGVAVDGNYALVGAEYWDQSNPQIPQLHQTAFLYRRSGTGWALVRQLEETVVDCCGPRNYTSLAMSGGVAAVATTPMTIYELRDSGWTLAPSEIPPGQIIGADLEIDNGRIMYNDGACSGDAAIVEKAADGVWHKTVDLPGAYSGCQSVNAGSVDISGDRAVVLQQSGTEIPYGEHQAWIFRNDGAQGWVRQGVATLPLLADQRLFSYSTHAAIRGADVFMSSGLVNGTYVFRDVPGQGFRIADRIRPVDSAMGGGESAQLRVSGDYLLQKTMLPDRSYQPSVLNIYRRGADARYDHVAALVHRSKAEWGGPIYEGSSTNVAFSGRTVLATDGYNRVVYHFELPATLSAPAPLEETFNVGIPGNWTASAGSQFTVLRGDRSRVLRQSQTAIDSRAIFEPADWTNEAIEVDVKVDQFADATSAISLVTRWQGPHNYYEVVWGPQRLEFRRMASGTLRTLWFYPSPTFNAMKPGRNYRLRLESIGARHQVFIDGQIWASVHSTGPTRGRVGLGTYHASADFDNVQVTPSPLATIYRNSFVTSEPIPLSSSVGEWGWRETDDGVVRLEQRSTTVEARLTIGTPTANQRVGVRAYVREFAPPAGTQRRWVGVVARYVDANNHYILALRNSNSLVLSKRVDGLDTTLGSFAVNVIPENSYDIRLDAIDNHLRAYLAERLLFEVTDDAHPSGAVGLTTYKAYAEFRDFVAYQP